MKEYGLALGGGGARGFVHIGVLRYIEEKGIKIKEISGTSMGAIIGAMFALGKSSQEIMDFAKGVNFLTMGDPDFRTGLLKGIKVEKLLRDVFGDMKIEDLNIPVKIVATNLETAESKFFEKGDLVDAIRASISLPGIFVPKVIDGESYVDGGVMKNLPIEVLDSEDVIAVSALKIKKGTIVKKKNFLGIDFKTGFVRNNYEIIKRSVLLMMKVNEDVSLNTDGKNISFVWPDFGDLDILDFNKLSEFVELGYETGRGVLK